MATTELRHGAGDDPVALAGVRAEDGRPSARSAISSRPVADAEKIVDRRRGAGARGAVGRRQHARRAVGARPGARVHRPIDRRRGDVSAVLGLIGRDLAVRDRRDRRRRGRGRRSSRCRLASSRPASICASSAASSRASCATCWSSRSIRRRLTDPEIAAEGERDRLKALAGRYSREDFMRAFDLLSRAGRPSCADRRSRGIQFEMALREVDPPAAADAAGGCDRGADRRVRRNHGRTRLLAASHAMTTGCSKATDHGGACRSVQQATPAPSMSAASVPQPRRDDGLGRAGDRGSGRWSAAISRLRFLAEIREQNKVFYGTVVAQAQKIDVEGDRVTFSFAPDAQGAPRAARAATAHGSRRSRRRRGRKMTVIGLEGARRGARARTVGRRRPADRQTSLRRARRGRAGVQAVLDVFGARDQGRRGDRLV